MLKAGESPFWPAALTAPNAQNKMFIAHLISHRSAIVKITRGATCCESLATANPLRATSHGRPRSGVN